MSSEILAGRLRRVPDGEPGSRAGWVNSQLEVMMAHPSFEMVTIPDPQYGPPFGVRLRSDVAPEDVRFEGVGYVESVLASFDRFRGLQKEGVVPDSWRFQFSLATPLAAMLFVHEDARAQIEEIYEPAVLADVDQILDAIPHEQLAIQWDTAIEFAILDGDPPMPSWFGDARKGIVERLVRIGNHIPADVELGYHLCYGDFGHKHFREPADTRHLVAVANGVSAALDRPMQWMHLPVPRDRDDEAYYAPLAELKLNPETELYLGLVHSTGGVEGTWRRIRAARSAIDDFGVGTECGLGRRAPETIPEVLRIHAAVSAPRS